MSLEKNLEKQVGFLTNKVEKLEGEIVDLKTSIEKLEKVVSIDRDALSRYLMSFEEYTRNEINATDVLIDYLIELIIGDD